MRARSIFNEMASRPWNGVMGRAARISEEDLSAISVDGRLQKFLSRESEMIDKLAAGSHAGSGGIQCF